MNQRLALRAAARHKQQRHAAWIDRVVEETINGRGRIVDIRPAVEPQPTPRLSSWQRFKKGLREVWEAIKDFCNTPPGYT